MYIHKLVAARFALHVSNSCLKIHSVKHEDAGCYILEALNCFGTILKRFDVRVVDKAKVDILFNNATGNLSGISLESRTRITVMVDGDLTIPYTISGDPKPSVRWLHNNSVLENVKYNGSHLTLHNVKPSDKGLYVVAVHNIHGKSNKSFWLSVREPQPTEEPTNPTVTGTTSFNILSKPSQSHTNILLATIYPSSRVTHIATPLTIESDSTSKSLNCNGKILKHNDSCDGKFLNLAHYNR
jgi:hypothetical protein